MSLIDNKFIHGRQFESVYEAALSRWYLPDAWEQQQARSQRLSDMAR
jgi:hypothetical protein